MFSFSVRINELYRSLKIMTIATHVRRVTSSREREDSRAPCNAYNQLYVSFRPDENTSRSQAWLLTKRAR